MALKGNTCLLIAYLIFNHVSAHIPMRYYNWAEPDAPTQVFDSADTAARSLNRQQSLSRLTAVRSVLADRGVDAYIVPTADAHNSQYIAPSDARREWVSGLSGSSGTALVTAAQALVWTDARYFTQFEIQVNTTYWTLMRQGTDATIQQWLLANLSPNSIVGIDPTTYTRSLWTPLETALAAQNITLLAITDNLIDIARRNIGDPPPDRPNNDLLALPVTFTGQRSDAKISQLLNEIRSRGASALILTALDDIAYTLNIRGSDIPYNPVFFSYLIIRSDVAAPNNVILFWSNGVLPANIAQHLSSEGVSIQARPYTEIFDYIQNMTTALPAGSTLWLSQDGSHAVHLAAETNPLLNTLSTLSPVQLIKCYKNEVELRGFRSAHIKDGVAVVRALKWVHDQVAAGVNVTEVDMDDALQQFRGEEEYYMGPSFSTIAGAGENGAIIHYSASRDGPRRVIGPNDMFLVDSGGQYMDGTTDITRTRHMSSNPTPAQRLAFTRVLKGQILLGTAVFPRGTRGHILETLARKALWDVGLNYAHGTGHGVGHFLNVHEGPSGILSSPMANDPGIIPGMIFSDEPGYYEVGEYGIRHEDLVESIELTRDSDHIYADGLVGDFNGVGAVGFYWISLVPHQTACLDVSILTDLEIKFINDYHARVFSTLGPILRDRNLSDDYDWLERECAPIQRSAAILIKSAPLLALLSVFSLWLSS